MRSLTVTTLALACSWSCQAADLGTRVPLAQREIAAHRTAKEAAACVAAQPFYWEIGNAERSLANGQSGEQAPGAQTKLALASASKWLYGAYVAEERQGKLSNEDVQFLSFQSGYTRFRVCLPNQTVGECQASLLNGRGRIDTQTIGLFDYNGGHMQKHATLMGLGMLNKDELAVAIKRGLHLGPDWALSYSQAQLAGGGVSTAADYARFLRATLKGDLQMGALLGTHPVCTNPLTCPKDAVKTPIPQSETWHYSVGHWVEDDPKVGDGAFSSPGAFGFYPWIDASKTFYGIVAREDRSGLRSDDPDQKPAVQSVDCGRLIRAAWLTGQVQP
ncbi:hypothetical protein [Aquabacterium sp. NJ1]|uniref:hypothetical protein n=1 Tax=Aquabacterium sp. NJ1 TaxID=1538295 RepID=UPI00068F33AF|nr:hypothetical protein [Aquabacterium sp. NJ1]